MSGIVGKVTIRVLSQCHYWGKTLIATLVSYTVGNFVAQAFACLLLDSREHTASDMSLRIDRQRLYSG